MDTTQSLSGTILYGWPYAGLVFAAGILAVLFLKPALPGQAYSARFRDPVWLVWAAVPMYMVHQFEEHGIDLLGRHFYFAQELCNTLGHADRATCPCDAGFIIAVNVSLVWFAGPLSGWVARQRPYVGATFLATPLVNAFAHIMPGLFKGQYNPGLLTSIVLFLPFCAYSLVVLRRRGVLEGPRLVSIPIMGVFLHLVLLLSLKGTEIGLLGHTIRDFIQVVNAFLPLAIALGVEKILGSRGAVAPSNVESPKA